MSKKQQKAALTISEIDLSTPIIKISDDEIKRNKGNKGSAEDILIRMRFLQKVEEALQQKLARPPSRLEKVQQMQAIGFTYYNISLMWHDTAKLRIKERWLSDLLTEGTFSAYQADTMDTVDYIKEQAVKFLNKTWTTSKTVTKTDWAGNTTSIETKSNDIASAKYQFLRILVDAVRLRMDMLKGDNVGLATAKLQEEFDKAKEELFTLTNKNQALEVELKKLMAKEGL